MSDYRTVQRGTSFLDGMAEQTIGSHPSSHPLRAQGSQPCEWHTAHLEWPEPQPLVARIEPEPYPLDALPPIIRAAVEEVQQFVQAPVPLVAASALTAISLAIQAHADVQRAERLTGPTSLFMLTIADSGERKTTCDGFFSSAIHAYQDRQVEQAKPLLKQYQAEQDAMEAKKSGIKDKLRQLAKEGKSTSPQEKELHDLESDAPEPPRVPRLLYSDVTPEALSYKLANQWPSAGLISSEAGIVFGAHGMGKESVMRNLSQINMLWDGGTLTIDRKTMDSFAVRGARLTVGLQVQEATLRETIERSGQLMRGTGFFARFLLAWPESTQGMRLFNDPPAHWPALEAFNRCITTLLEQEVPIDEVGALNPTTLAFSTEAKAEWRAYHDAIESELKSGGEFYDVRDVASKSADNAARLAALFQIFSEGMGVIGEAWFTSASRIAAWHLNESRRFFGELAMPAELAHAVRLERWLLAYCFRSQTDSVPTRIVQQSVTGISRDKDTISKAVMVLNEHGRARIIQDGKRRLIQINPALLAFATATHATSATNDANHATTVATVAPVAVANLSEEVMA
ncbi:MAG: hypothetical protein H6R01_536 [Burkholderiaceae bacterium]|nr:hypothetical protein [Burkholderiaceae bacterium]